MAYVALIFKPYVVRQLNTISAITSMSDSTEGKGKCSTVKKVEELAMHPARLVFGNVAVYITFSRLSILFRDTGLSCCCFTAFSCLKCRARGSFHMTYGQTCSKWELVL